MPVPPSVSRLLSRLQTPSKPARRIAFVAVPLLLVAVAAFARLGRNGGTIAAGARTCSVQKRDFVRVRRLNGVLEASRYHSVVVPRLAGPGGPLVITKLATAGTVVKAGDMLAEFDQQAQLKNYLEREAEYLGLVEQLKQKRAERLSASGQDDADVRKAENDVQRARLDVSKSEVLSRIDADKHAQTLAEAEARLAHLQKKAKARATAARADVRSLEIRAERARRSQEHARRNMKKMDMRAPMEGVVVLLPIWKNDGNPPSEPQEGDEIRPGNPFMQVVDPNTMQVRVKVNQADLHLLSVGQKAEVRLDAYPDARLAARIDQLGSVGSSAFSERVRLFAAIVAIEGAEPRMMPDLSAAVDVELERTADALVLPRDAVRETEEGQGVVRLRGGGTREVKLGPRSDHEVVIVSGLDAGAEVLRAGEGS